MQKWIARIGWGWILPLVLITGSCVSSQKIGGDRKAPDLDKTLTMFTFIEKGDLVTFIVNTRPARYREDDGYVPFEIAVVNSGLRRIVLSREAFTLIDSEGNRYPCAEPRELMEGYEFLDLDRVRRLRLQRLELILREEHILTLREFVALGNLVALDVSIVRRAVVAVLHLGAALLVHHAEPNRTRGLRRRKDLDRNRNKAKGDGS